MLCDIIGGGRRDVNPGGGKAGLAGRVALRVDFL